jgi:hypothetical protein
LKELEDLRVQLSLPGADPVAVEASVDAARGASSPSDVDQSDTDSGEADELTIDGSESGDDEELDAAATQPHPQGLVARGAADDPF